MIPVRGRIYRADLGNGLKPFLIVSNNRRNNQLESALAVRLTTSVKPELPSIVILQGNEVLAGRVLCDDIVLIYRDELKDDLGALTRQTMVSVGKALSHALGL